MTIGIVAGLLAMLGVQSALGQSYSGQATVINLSDIHNQPIPPGGIIFCDTGPLPGIGGNLSVSVAGTNAYNGALAFQNASAATVGASSQANSQASVQSLTLEFMDANGGANTLTVDSISVSASAICDTNGPVVGGSSQISGLVIDGQSIAVSGAANQTINFNGFSVVLNEQSSFSDANRGEIDVTAIHVMVPGCMDGILVTAHADINCSGCPPCVDPQLGLGSAGGCTVLELGAHQVSVTGPAGGILGDVCIAPNGKFAMSGDEYVTGAIRLGPGAQYQNSSHSAANVQYNADLSAEINDAYAAYNNALSLPCTQNYAKLDGSVTTITGNVGLNVICVGDVVLAGKQVYLTGPAGAKFIVKVSGKFALTGGGAGPQIRVAGGVQPKDVLYVLVGTGEQVAFSGGGAPYNYAAIVDGTLLAPYRKIALSPGLVNGEVISGQDISIVSGASVRCPSCQ